MDKWTPKTTGMNFELPETLKPLSKYKEKISILSGWHCTPQCRNPVRARAIT